MCIYVWGWDVGTGVEKRSLGVEYLIRPKRKRQDGLEEGLAVRSSDDSRVREDIALTIQQKVNHGLGHPSSASPHAQ